MFHYLSSMILLNFAVGDTIDIVTPECNLNLNETSTALLDVATSMIEKAMLKFPVCSNLKPVDCEEVLSNGQSQSGIYTVWPRSRVSEDKPLQVSCDMETEGGGWTVIQRRGNFGRAKDYFFQDWASYKKGFGDIAEEFWLGNDNIYALASQRLYSIRFDFKAVDGETSYALYDSFWIDDEDHMYKLHIKDYKGTAGDSMTIQHDNAKFSTRDKDNDSNEEMHCAVNYRGAWWYNSCHHSNLNGYDYKGHHARFGDGVNWSSWRHFNESLEFTKMMIRPANFRKTVV